MESEKKAIIKNLIETGKAKGVLTYSEITEALDELEALVKRKFDLPDEQ